MTYVSRLAISEMLTLSGPPYRNTLIGPLVLVETAKCFSLVMLSMNKTKSSDKDARLIDFFQNAP
jgi:hypothetical protein